MRSRRIFLLFLGACSVAGFASGVTTTFLSSAHVEEPHPDEGISMMPPASSLALEGVREMKEEITALSWAPSQKRLAVSAGAQVSLWTADLAFRQTLAFPMRCSLLACSDQYIAASDQELVVYDWKSGHYVEIPAVPRPITGLAWVADTLLCACDQQLISWRQYRLRQIAVSRAPIQRLAVVADRCAIAVGQEVMLLQGASWHEVATIPLSLPVRALAWSPDGRYLAIADEGGELALYRGPRQEKRVLSEHIASLAWSADGKCFISIGEGGLTVWDTSLHQQAKTLYQGQEVVWISSNHVLCSNKKQLTLWKQNEKEAAL
uniref:Anaphase-promoting complex subunit 4-like WD40 domain-containing protein n=1 Tax=Thermosporothrix sp. COM3 TaxID=2490863 RepID=A0A455SJU4_9CHLR|nr:hypothetical protein KTC_19430 [Thermosporothrix sp. COM3]